MTTCADGNVLEELLTLLKLEKIEENIFRGQSQDLGFGNVFGGQVLGQALSAASQTVREDRSAHSLHAYFLRPGRRPKTDCLQRGHHARRRQLHHPPGRGHPERQGHIFMSASFHIDEPGFDHQDPMPQVQAPEALESELAMAKRLKDKIPPALRDKLLCAKPIEFRPVDPQNPFAPKKREPVRCVWVKAIGSMPSDRSVHRYLLAYASDFGLVTTALYPHGHSFWEPDIMAASLDHAMWFHRNFDWTTTGCCM